NLSKISTGRKTLYLKAFENNLLLSEADIRKILINLEEINFVENKRGRKGSVISEEGIRFLKENL
ncbi:MAG: hypothetical protein ACRCZI_13320, partial [Cetobacterium sp.]